MMSMMRSMLAVIWLSEMGTINEQLCFTLETIARNMFSNSFFIRLGKKSGSTICKADKLVFF